MERNILTVNEDSFYTAKIEEVDGWLFLHCEVHSTTPSSIKRIKKQIKDVKEVLSVMGYDKPLLSVTRNSHFAKLLKGKYLGDVCENNEILGVWSWE